MIEQPLERSYSAIRSTKAELPQAADKPRSGVAIEAPTPGITQTPGINFRRAATGGERVVAWNGVILVWRRCAIDVDAQHLAQQCIYVLPVILRVVGRAAVAEADEQFSETVEGDVTAVVVGEGLIERKDLLLAGGIERGAAVVAGEARDDGGKRVLGIGAGARIGEKNLRCTREIGVKRHAQQTAFAGGIDGNVDEHGRLSRCGGVNVGKNNHSAVGQATPAFDDKPARVVARCLQPSGSAVGLRGKALLGRLCLNRWWC